MKIIGYVIVNEEGKLFAGYRHPATRISGSPVWVDNLSNSLHYGGNAAVYNHVDSADNTARWIFSRDGIKCAARCVMLDMGE